jgi:hypothetical protein
VVALVTFYRERDSGHWASRLLLGHKHVDCMVSQDPGWWAYSNFGPGGLRLSATYGSTDDMAQAMTDAGGLVLVGDCEAPSQQLPFIINSCVGYTKAVLGISSYAVTPSQLFRHLLRRGYQFADVDRTGLWRA